MYVKNAKLFSLLLLFFILLAANPTYLSHVHADLVITVTTDKQLYGLITPGEAVHIIGNLALNDLPVPDGLVSLQVNTRIGALIYRTFNTGTTYNWTRPIEITDAYIGNDIGTPLASAKRGSTVWIWIWYKNNLETPVHTAIAFTIYTLSKIPLFAFVPQTYDVSPDGPWFTAYQWQVPANAELGTATIYASAFSDFPANEGVPYCPEKSSTFTIQSATSSTTQQSSQPIHVAYESGTFNTSFYISSKGGRLGNYTIYVNSFYLGVQGSSSKRFEVMLLGDIFTDGVVDVSDLVLMVTAVPSTPDSPNWNPKAELTGDGIVDVSDQVVLINNIGNYGSY